MGFSQVGVGLLVMLVAFGFSDAQWQARARSRPRQMGATQFRPRAWASVPVAYDAASAVFSQQSSSSQFPVQTQPQTVIGSQLQDPLAVQSQQLMQSPMMKLNWTFPSLPVEPQQPSVPFALHYPLPANSVAAQCNESSVYVEARKDFFGNGELQVPSAFTLGGCAPIAEDPTAQVVIFESELQACGSVPVVTENELIYKFNLIFTPQDASYGVPIARSTGAVVGIECHYSRLQNVSSNSLMPAWMPYAATLTAEEIFVFSLRLMTDDWKFERPSNQYLLGDIINIEASVVPYNHVPLRVFVDNCVATAVPDVASVPRYSFIENNGCLVDAKLTGSRSAFMPRTQGDQLQFQLDAFRFQQTNSGLVYVTCVLKVTAASAPISPEQKACSFSTNGWTSADGSDQVCSCCDTTCTPTSASASDTPVTGLSWTKISSMPFYVKGHN